LATAHDNYWPRAERPTPGARREQVGGRHCFWFNSGRRKLAHLPHRTHRAWRRSLTTAFDRHPERTPVDEQADMARM